MGPKDRRPPFRKRPEVQRRNKPHGARRPNAGAIHRRVGVVSPQKPWTAGQIPIDVSAHPSYSFVTLRIAPTKLERLRDSLAGRTQVASSTTGTLGTALGCRDVTQSEFGSAYKRNVPSVSACLTSQQLFIGVKEGSYAIDPLTADLSGQTVLGTQYYRSPSLAQQSQRSSQVTVDPTTCTPNTTMAPVRDPNSVQSSIKDVVHNLFEIQTQVHGFVPETQQLLIDKMSELAQSLAHLQKITSPVHSPENPIHKTRIAPEIIDYVDDGRNPDIFTRDFVELVQRGNAVINGKQQAFQDFSQIFAAALKEGIPDVEKEVDLVMGKALNESQAPVEQRVRENGASRF